LCVVTFSVRFLVDCDQSYLTSTPTQHNEKVLILLALFNPSVLSVIFISDAFKKYNLRLTSVELFIVYCM
jgi:hypothetical protein